MGHTVDQWIAECAACGWSGSSKDCFGGNQGDDVGDYGDLQCPSCLSHSVDAAADMSAPCNP